MAEIRAVVGRERELGVFDISIQLLGFNHPYTRKRHEASRFDGEPRRLFQRSDPGPARATRSVIAGRLWSALRHDEVGELLHFFFAQLLAELRHRRALAEKIFGGGVVQDAKDPAFDPSPERFGPSPLSPGLTS